jgi:hypothetical protein
MIWRQIHAGGRLTGTETVSRPRLCSHLEMRSSGIFTTSPTVEEINRVRDEAKRARMKPSTQGCVRSQEGGPRKAVPEVHLTDGTTAPTVWSTAFRRSSFWKVGVPPLGG